MVEAWPLDTLSAIPGPPPIASSGLSSIPEGVFQRNGVWLQVEDELVDHADMEAEEYSDAASISDRF